MPLAVTSLAEMTVADVARLVGRRVPQLYRFSRRAETEYQGRRDGSRVFHVPEPQLKNLLRDIYEEVLAPLPISDSVHSQRGKSVISNAEAHVGHPFMIALDVQHCYPSTGRDQVRRAFAKFGFDPQASGLLARLCTCRGILPQGSPCSQAIMNMVFADIDEALIQLARRYGAVYTRYVDDLFFSGSHELRPLMSRVESELRRNGYRSNAFKRRVYGPTQPHVVTKIVVTPTGLDSNPEFLKDLTDELHRLEPDSSTVSRTRARSRIGWVTRLNPGRGKDLLKVWKRRLAD